MLNVLRPAVSRVLTPLGRALADRGVSPDMVTAAGTAGAVASALYFFPRGELWWGSLAVAFFVLADMLDGVIARARGGAGSRWGAFLDSSLDRIADASIFAGLIYHFFDTGQRVLAGVALFCLIAGMLVSYVKARAEGLGMTCDVGLAERTERLIIVLVSAGFGHLFGVPYLTAAGLWLLAAASAFTVVQRLMHVRRQAVPE
jgi:Phosphatidylglycerophosphate synthase